MKLLSVARDVRRRRARERTGLFAAEGVRTVEELLASPLSLRGALVSPALEATDRGRALRALLESRAATAGFELLGVSDSELASAADTDSPQGVVALADRPERAFDAVDATGRCVLLVLDGIQDPGNAGTILRTAEAFGVTATVAVGGTVDLWNPKVVRSAMGALFRHMAFAASAEATLEFVRESQAALWATSADGEPLGGGTRAPERLAIVVGNEGGGVTRRVADAADRVVAIPIRGVESLNVAVATGIILYALTQ